MHGCYNLNAPVTSCRVSVLLRRLCFSPFLSLVCYFCHFVGLAGRVLGLLHMRFLGIHWMTVLMSKLHSPFTFY